MADEVKQGDQVAIEYTGKLQDGTVFDTTEGRDAFTFTAGSDNIIKGVNDAVVGMQVGEQKTVEVPPEEAYGDYNQELVVKVERDRMPENVNVGDALSDSSSGKVWYVRDLNEEVGVLDGNHPLAGQTLVFEIQVVNVGEAQAG